MSLPAGRVTNDPTNYLGIALQSAKDVAGSTFYYLKHLDGSGFDVAVDQSSERIGGSGKEIGLRYRTKVTADGQYVTYADPDATGRILYAAIGADVITAAGGITTHKIFTGSTTGVLPYQTVQQNWADETEQTTNCQISDLKLEGEAGHPVKLTAQFVSGGSPVAGVAPAVPTREANPLPYMIPGGSVAITAQGALTVGASLGGGSSLQVTKWSLDIKNTLDDAIQTVALNREDVLWLNADYDIDGTLKYIDKKFWESVQYGGATQVPTGALTNGQFTFFTNLGTAGGASNQSLLIFCPFVEFTSVKVNRLDPDGKTMYIDYVASTRNIGTSSVQCTVQNLTAGNYNNPAT
jgi:hypothetical protein